MLGETVRQIGEKAGGGLVLMHGIETRPLAPLRFRQAGYPAVAKRLAREADVAFQECSGYFFLYDADPRHAPLREVTVTGKTDPAFYGISAAVVLSAGTTLSNAFKVLSQVLGVTVVADNAVADARCGELTLGDIPLPDILEALLKSARVYSFEVDSTEEYIFIRSPRNVGLHVPALVNPELLDDHQNAFLESRVNVLLPLSSRAAQPSIKMGTGARPLSEMLEPLSGQLGVRVVAERGLEVLPVNPVSFHGVRVRTALDLIIRQWLVSEIGYQVLPDRIVIRRVIPTTLP
jgi:hypothetical protein